MIRTQYARIYGRFNSRPQERGDSRRRQIEGAVAYAKENDLELVKGADGKPLVYFDEGVSGKAGLNLEKEFGRLLKEAKAGEIILCEAIDRIGRQNPTVAVLLKSDGETFLHRYYRFQSNCLSDALLLYTQLAQTSL